jgi:hypothetical protein
MEEFKMKLRVLGGLLAGATILTVTTPAMAADLNVTSDPGTTTLTITDYTVDPTTQLPSDPGAFTFKNVPNIDFGTHSLDSIADTNATFDGTFDAALQIKDTRPTAQSISEAEALIDAAVPTADVTADQISASKTAWDNAVEAGAWKIDASATQLDGIGTSLTIDGTEVLTAPGTVVTETATAPVGTKDYTLNNPVLTIANNNLEVKTYNGTITYTATAAV